MGDSALEADCERCFGLCCTALSFERSEQFGHDKLAGQACQYLQGDFRCRIHARKLDLGYEGCVDFDCLGAGQRASALFAGSNWQRDPVAARQMYASFSSLMRLQEMRQALQTAATLSLPEAVEAERIALHERIAARADSRAQDIGRQAAGLLDDARLFLERLRPMLEMRL